MAEPKVIAKYLFSSEAPQDADTVLHGDAKWNPEGGVTLGGKGYVQLPAIHFQSRPFSFGFWIKPKPNHSNWMCLYADWSNTWSFRTSLIPSGCKYNLYVILRREYNGNWDMFNENVAEVTPSQWSSITFSWDGKMLDIYINGSRVNNRVKSADKTDTRIQGNDHKFHEFGIKMDSKSEYFVGDVKNLVVAEGAITAYNALKQLGVEEQLEKHRSPRRMPFQTGKNGVLAVYLRNRDSEDDKDVQLGDDAIWAGDDGVILGGHGYVKVPAVKFQHHDFTIGIYANPNGFSNQQMTLYSDWRHWWSFIFFLIPVPENQTYQLAIRLRRNIQQESDLVYVHGGVVMPNRWNYLAASWNGETGICRLRIDNTTIEGRREEHAGDEKEVQSSDREFHDVGVKGDWMDQRFVGRLKWLFIMNVAAN